MIRLRWWLFPMLATLGACNAQPSADAVEAGETGSLTSADAPSRDKAVALAVPEAERANYSDFRVVSTPKGTVLLGEYAFPDSEVSHALPGRIDAFYLAPMDNGKWTMSQRYDKAVQGGGMGTIGTWSLSDAFLRNPVVVAETGYTGQGRTLGCTVMVELNENGPRTIASIPVFDQIDDRIESKGSIGDVVRGKSFTVTYSGARSGNVEWLWTDSEFVPSGPAPINSCGEG